MSSGKNHNRPKMMGRPGGGHGPGGHGMMPGEKAKDFKGTLKKLLEYLGNYKWAVLVVLFFAAASTVLAIFGHKILGQATTELFEGLIGTVTGTGEGIDFARIG